MPAPILRGTPALALLALLACGVPPGEDADEPPTDDTDAPGVDTDTGDAGWGIPYEITLRVPTTTPPELDLDLARDEVAALFGDAAADVVLLELDPEPLLKASLDRIKAACGTDWQRDVREPVFDCALTELGRSFRGRDGTWRTSPELALIQILTMTPANADVAGTSVETLAGIADAIGLGGGFGQILADALKISRTTEFLATDAVARGMRESLLGSHPALRADGRIPVTLQDALTDLRTLGERLGPSGSHPGIVDPDSVTSGHVLTEDFAMRAVVRSNLAVLDGLDLSHGKDYLGLIVDTTGPTFDDEVEFDFTDPDRFSVRGVVDDPRIDLRFFVRENPRFVPACAGVAPGADCRQNAPGNPVGTRTVWTTPPWEIEHAIAAAGRWRYGGLQNKLCYVLCAVDLKIGQGQDPPGFARFDVLLSIGFPPDPQYVWELIDEVAQVRLHDGVAGPIPEGEADVAFTMEDVPVGLTLDAITEGMRPVLQAQNHLVSDFLLGDFRKNSGPVDLFYRRTEDGQPTLFWVGPEELGERDWTYTRTGLYADPELTRKLSSLTLPGSADTTHEKWRPPLGDSVVYAVDDEGRTYRLVVIAQDLSSPEAELTVIVREAP